MIINDLDGYYIVFDTKNWNTELDTLVSRANGGFSPYAWLNPKRSLFFKLIWQGATVRQAVAICLHIPLYRRVIRKAKMLTKAAVKQVLGDAGVKAVKKALGK